MKINLTYFFFFALSIPTRNSLISRATGSVFLLALLKYGDNQL
jgi:hypothetical protein